MRKYKNHPIGGYRSKAERNHALWLESERRQGKIKSWEYEKSFPLAAWNGSLQSRNENIERATIIGHHKPDFFVELKNGATEVHEIKGGMATQTEAWRLRKKIFEANYPHIQYRVFSGQEQWRLKDVIARNKKAAAKSRA